MSDRTNSVTAKSIVTRLSLLSLAAVFASPALASAPVVGMEDASRIAGKYIVVLHKDLADDTGGQAAVDSVANTGGAVSKQFSYALKGFAATLTSESVEQLRLNPAVKYISAQKTFSINETQSSAPWGLDRVDQTSLPLSGDYSWKNSGSGVTAYIIDTGIQITHKDFGGRAVSGFSAINDGQGTNDCQGHGTHVSATVGGTSYGIAKSASIVAVRVLNCQGQGSTEEVIAGIEWVTKNHKSPAVVNMSLGGGADQALDDAVAKSIQSGVTFAVAAGNDGLDACNSSPARVPQAITVGASDIRDSGASFTSIGKCLDIFAPGVDITSAWKGSDTATKTISGTSMASPHTAGVAALYLSANPTASPAQVESYLVSSSVKGALKNIGNNSPNRLLNTEWNNSGTNPTPVPTSNPTPVPTVNPTPGPTAVPTVRPTPQPSPTPTPGVPGCSGCQTVIGEITSTGGRSIQPDGKSFQIGQNSKILGNMIGPVDSDFDLALQKWNGWFWYTVATSDSNTNVEKIQYNAWPGSFRWIVTAESGSGKFSLSYKSTPL